MREVQIQNETYNLPEGWQDVSISLFNKIVKHSSLLNDYKSKTQFALEMFAMLLDADINIVKRLSREHYQVLSDECDWVNKEIIATDKEQFEINGDIYIPIKDFNKLSMGESIDLELIINESESTELLENILPLIIRKAKPVMKDGQTVLEPLDYDAESYAKHKELFVDHLMIADVLKFKDFFLNGEK